MAVKPVNPAKSTDTPFVFNQPAKTLKDSDLSKQRHSQNERNSKDERNSKNKRNSENAAKPVKPATYAAIVNKDIGNKDKSWITVQKKATKPVTKPISYRDRCLVMKPKTVITAINLIEMCNNINSALKAVKVDNVLVFTVAISQSGTSIVFTTSEGTAEDLLQHQHV